MINNGNGNTDLILDDVVSALDKRIDDKIDAFKETVFSNLSQEVEWRKSAIQKVDNKINSNTTKLSGEISTNVNSLSDSIGDIDDLSSTLMASNLVEAINKVHSVQLSTDGATNESLLSEVARAKQKEEELLNRSKLIANWNSSATTVDISVVDRANSLLGQEIALREKDRKEIVAQLTNEVVRAQRVEGDLSRLPDNVDKTNLVSAMSDIVHQTTQTVAGVNNRIDTLSDSVLLLNPNTDDIQHISGDVSVEGNFHTSKIIVGDIEIDNLLKVHSNSELLGSTSVTGDLSVGGATNIGGDTIISGNTTINNDIIVKGKLTVEGETITNILQTTFTQDSLIVSRDGATEHPIEQSGLAINLKKDGDLSTVVGVVYDPVVNGMVVCRGTLDADNKLNSTTALPIALCDNNTITTQNIAIFKSGIGGNIVVADSGISKQQVDTLQSEHIQLSDKVSTLEQSLQSTDNEIENTDVRLSRSITDVQNNLDDLSLNLTKQISDFSLDIDKRVGQKQDAYGQIIPIQTQINELDSRLIKYENSLSPITQLIEKESADRLSALEQLEQRFITSVQQEVDRAQREETYILQKIETLKIDLSDGLEESQEIRDAITEHAIEYDNKIAEINSNIGLRFEAVTDSINTEVEIRKKDVGDLYTTMNELSSSILNKYSEIVNFYAGFKNALILGGGKYVVAKYDMNTNEIVWSTIDEVLAEQQ